MQRLILTSIMLSQIGFVATYIVFTSKNFKPIFQNTFHIDVNQGIIILTECEFYIPMSFIRKIKRLTPATLIANIFILIGLIMIVFNMCAHIFIHGLEDFVMFNKSRCFLFVDTGIFAFEGASLVIPIQDSMKKTEKFPKVLLKVLLCTCILFILIGAVSYLAFGNNVHTVIILDLQQNSRGVTSIQMVYSLAIMLSVSLQIFPAIKIMEHWIFNELRKDKFTDQVVKKLCTFTCHCYRLNLGLSRIRQLRYACLICRLLCLHFACPYLPSLMHIKVCNKEIALKWLDIVIMEMRSITLCYAISQIFTR